LLRVVVMCYDIVGACEWQRMQSAHSVLDMQKKTQNCFWSIMVIVISRSDRKAIVFGDFVWILAFF